MATNWPPTSYPAWPPAEIGEVTFSDIQTAIRYLRKHSFTWANPTTNENTQYFTGVRCDHNHACKGIMIISPGGLRYPFAYCQIAAHRAALVLWVVGYDGGNNPVYDLGWGSGITP